MCVYIYIYVCEYIRSHLAQAILFDTLEVLPVQIRIQMTLFSRWVCSDINTDVLMKHNGPTLLDEGVAIETLNVFRLFESKYCGEDCLIVMSCLCPPTDWKEILQHLHTKYAKWTPDGPSTRSWYDTLCYEAVVAQMTRATVCSIARSGDLIWPCKTPAILCPMAPVPWYKPKACNHAADKPLHELAGGESLTMRASLNGPISVCQFIKADGRIELLDLCRKALSINIHVLFLAEWDGALCRACVNAFRYQTISYQPNLHVARATPKRKLNSSTGYTYPEFFEHAEGNWLEELLRNCLGDVVLPQEVLAELRVNKRACISTAVMWHYGVPSDM